jgi:hypothetical protein
MFIVGLKVRALKLVVGLVSLAWPMLLLLDRADAAVSPNQFRNQKFYYDPNEFKSTLSLALSAREQVVKIPKQHLMSRLDKGTSDPRVEPLQLTVDLQEDRLMDLATRVARPNHRLALANFLKGNFDKGEPIPGTNLRLVSITKDAFELIDPEAFDSLFSKIHHAVSLDPASLRQNKNDRIRFLNEITPFLSSADIKAIESKINRNQSLSLDRDLLPAFARKRIAGHTVYRGPNCFHAALGFQSQRLASSSLVNVRREVGYHQDMLNYDELWRILKLSFYEIDPRRSELQYGDMIVFFEAKDADKPGVDFKTLRHAATYLMGGYVFAKGSKSANSPYLVRTLAEEWKTWSRYTSVLGVKVFRRNLKHVSNPVPTDPVDWVY